MMPNRSGLKRTPPAKAKKSPKSGGSSPQDESPTSVAAGAAAASAAVPKKSAKSSIAGKKVSNLSVFGVSQQPGDDDAVPAVLVSDSAPVDPLLEAEYNELKEFSPTAKESLMWILNSMPDEYNIFRPVGLAWTKYGEFVFSHHVGMKVLRVCLLWYEHEKYHDTDANWSHDHIKFSVASDHDELMASEYVMDHNVTFLSYDQISYPLSQHPAITKKPAVGSSVVTVSNATLKDVSPSKIDGSVSALRSDLMAESKLWTPPSRR